jgi:hypothetical protein
MDSTCDHCGVEYVFTANNSVINLYADPKCNHVSSKCPSGHNEVMYLSWPSVVKYTQRHIRVNVCNAIPAGLQASASRAWAKVAPKQIEAPKEYKELWRSPRREAYIDHRVSFLGHMLERIEPGFCWHCGRPNCDTDHSKG